MPPSPQRALANAAADAANDLQDHLERERHDADMALMRAAAGDDEARCRARLEALEAIIRLAGKAHDTFFTLYYTLD